MIDLDRYVGTQLLELAHDAIFIRNWQSGRILFWNRAAEALYGFSRDEALGNVSHDLLRTQFPQPLQEIVETMLSTGRWEGELVHCTADGREVVVESRWALQRDETGQPLAFLETNRDITQRKRAQAELDRRIDQLTRANEEIARRNHELAAINLSVAAISRELDLPHVLQSIVDAARELVGARYAALGVADSRGRITQFITAGITPEQRAAIGPLPQGHGLLAALIKHAEPLRVRNIAHDPRSHGFPPNHPPMTSLLGVPILSGGKAVGDLYLTDKIGSDDFSEGDQELLMILAGHAAIAIENAHLYEDVRSARDQLKSWNRNLEAIVAERTREIERMSRESTRRILQAQEDERKRIARELHDETAQSLATVLISIDLLKGQVPEDGEQLANGISRLERLVKQTLDEVRTMAHDLRPTILDDFGLVAAIQAHAEEWTRTFGVPVRVSVESTPAGDLAKDMEIGIFRIAQEALMNAGKYAQAQKIQVFLSFSDDVARLVVQDDGVGFNPDEVEGPTRQGGWGLQGMRERAALLNADLSIEGIPGKGTTVRLTVPVRLVTASD